ncbi:phospholipase D family protein [Candidatus Micrarchaeota archaeon]|nr:phospholipase D family protein [Candidatus Micrarchaeota archaeon]
MKILSCQDLLDSLHNLSMQVKDKLWIATPYLGNWEAIRNILGNKWIDDGNVNVRLLTDISDYGGLNYESIKYFQYRGKIKSIIGLHAKIYIIDDNAILASANLTGTAFSRRYEVAVLFEGIDAIPLIELYEQWWNNVAEEISSDWRPKKPKKGLKQENDEMTHEKLPIRWELPIVPNKKIEWKKKFLDYESYLNKYSDLANMYNHIQRLWPKSPLFFEIDAFLNYLFHHAPGKPTKSNKATKSLNQKDKELEIRKYAHNFKKWIDNGSDGIETNERREKSSNKINNMLRKDRIETVSIEEVKQVIDQFNCMNSVPLNKTRFLNPNNNDLHAIRDAWKNLLFGMDPLAARMLQCSNALKYFGNSSIYELLAFYYPEKYPIRNSNSSSGLRFFGYDVSIY